MKKTTILILFCIWSSMTFSQEYYEFPDSNTYWYEWHRPVDFWLPGNEPHSNIFGLLNQDTLINGKYFHKLFKFYNDSLLPDSSEFIGAIREDENKKVYYIGPDLYGIGPYDSVDIILYDFSLLVGDTFTNGLFTINEYLVVSEIDSILIKDTYRKRINFQDYNWVKWIEGIGNQSGLLFYSGDITWNGIMNWLVCYSENDGIIYHDPQFDSCYYNTILTNIQSNNSSIELTIMPNPCQESFIIAKSDKQIKSISIFDLLGRLVLHKEMINNNYCRVKVSSLLKGNYVLKAVLNDDKIASKKLIIK